MSKKELAQQIINEVGGEVNIKEVSHCMTRLRLTVNDQKQANIEKVEKLPGVMKVIAIGDQLQIVLGGIVDEVFDEVASLIENNDIVSKECVNENIDETVVEKQGILNRLITLLSGIISPIIPAMMASGFITTTARLAIILGVPETNSTIQLLLTFGDVLYGFFPIIIAWSAARYFKANAGVTLMVIGILVYPGFTNLFNDGASISFLGINVANVYYGSSVLPAIFGTYLLAKIDNWLRNILPSFMKSIFVPFLSALIVTPLLITIIGPIGVWGGKVFASIFTKLYEFSPILAGGLIGGIWQILIIFGMHIAILGMVTVPNIAATGRDTVIMTHAPSLICQVTAGLAVALKAKDKGIKKNAFTLSIMALLSGSVVEPVMYGVNLKYKKPFIAVCIGGAIGGAITGASFAGTTAAVAFGIYTFPVYFGQGFKGLLLGCLVGGLTTFALTYAMGIDERI